MSLPLRLSGFALLGLVMLVMLFPFVEMLSTSLKSQTEYLQYPPVWFPENPVLENYVTIWYYAPLATFIRNSLIIALGATLLNAIVAIPASYCLARFQFRGRQAILIVIVATQMFAPVVLLLATFRMMFSLGMLNTYWSLIFLNATVALPFTIWMMTAYFSTIPKEIEEAAVLDKAGRFRILIDHLLPISMPGLVTALTFCFVIAWNEFLFAQTLITNPTMRPLTTGIYTYVGRRDTEWNFLMASSVISILPVFLAFLLVQRRLISGLSAGAVK